MHSSTLCVEHKIFFGANKIIPKLKRWTPKKPKALDGKITAHLAKRLKKSFFESGSQDDEYYTRIDF
jgi:hypothetical protein